MILPSTHKSAISLSVSLTISASKYNRRFASLRQQSLRSRERGAATDSTGVEAGRRVIRAVMVFLGYEYRIESVSPDGSEDNAVVPVVARGARLLEAQYPAELPAGASPCLSEAFEVIVGERIFTGDEPPRWVLIVSESGAVPIDRSKWQDKRYLSLDFSGLHDRPDTFSYHVSTCLLARETLIPGAGESLVDRLSENSHKHAFAVSEDLKCWPREAVELLGNYAVGRLGAKALAGKDDDPTHECLRDIAERPAPQKEAAYTTIPSGSSLFRAISSTERGRPFCNAALNR